MAQSASWISQNVFNQQAFVETTGKVLGSDASRQDIATIIVDQALADRPLVKRVAGEQATSLITGLLGSDLAANAYNRISNTAYAFLTSPNQQDIAIDLTAIKGPISGIVSFAENRGREVSFEPSQIPDTITIIDADDVPDLSGFVQGALIFNVVFWIVAIGAFAWYIFLQSAGRIRRTYQVLLTLAITAAISLATDPYVAPAIASFVSLVQARGLVTDMTNAFLDSFYVRMWYVLAISGLVALVISLRHHAKRGAEYVIASIDGSRKSSKS